MYFTRLKALCDASGVLPSSMMLSGELEDLGTRPSNSSSSASIYKATYHGRMVAVKVLNAHRLQTPENVHRVRASLFEFVICLPGYQRLVKEAVGWALLRHENVLPFVGIATKPNRFSIVSEWIPNGDAMSFIARNPNRNLYPLVSRA